MNHKKELLRGLWVVNGSAGFERLVGEEVFWG